MMKIEFISPSEAEKLLALIVSVDEEAPFLIFERNERKQETQLIENYISVLNGSPLSILLGAKDDRGEFVGYVAGEGSQKSRLSHTLVLNIAIKSNYANRNIGESLMNAFIKQARNQGIRRLEDTAVCENKPCLALAKKLNFSIEGIKKDAVKIKGKYFDSYMLAKILSVPLLP